jgi:hypothetical protein
MAGEDRCFSGSALRPHGREEWPDAHNVHHAREVVADVQAAADAAQDDADAALVNAANKDITDDEGNVFTDVRDAVNDLLGID